MTSEQGKKVEQKTPLNQEQIKAQIAAIKANPELLNALKSDPEVAQPGLSDLKDTFGVEINKYGDIHFKKNMQQSCKHFSGISICAPLTMKFEEGKIVITPGAAKASA